MNVEWVLYAGMAAWTGIGAYLFFLARRQTALSLRLQRMERMMEEKA